MSISYSCNTINANLRVHFKSCLIVYHTAYRSIATGGKHHSFNMHVARASWTTKVLRNITGVSRQLTVNCLVAKYWSPTQGFRTVGLSRRGSVVDCISELRRSLMLSHLANTKRLLCTECLINTNVQTVSNGRYLIMSQSNTQMYDIDLSVIQMKIFSAPKLQITRVK